MRAIPKSLTFAKTFSRPVLPKQEFQRIRRILSARGVPRRWVRKESYVAGGRGALWCADRENFIVFFSSAAFVESPLSAQGHPLGLGGLFFRFSNGDVSAAVRYLGIRRHGDRRPWGEERD